MSKGNQFWERVKDRVEYRLINVDRNLELLQDIPYRCYLDMAIVYHLKIYGPEDQITTATITNHLMDKWEVMEEDLYEAASVNTPQLDHVICEDLTMFLLGMLGDGDELKNMLADEKNQVPLHTLTNQSMILGAATILYPGVLRDISDWMGGDLIILPSSIHEVLLLKYEDGMPLDELTAMVQEINRTEVPEKDILSEHVYLYRRNTDEIEISSEYCEVTA